MKRRKVIRIASRIFVVLCLISLISLGCADRWILGQNHETIVPSGVRSAVVSVDGRRVECWVARSPGGRVREPEGFVLFFVGKAERTDRWTLPVAQAWGERAVEVWGMNYPGSGGSDGPARMSLVGPSALVVYDHVRSIAGSRPIFIHAGSFGTTAGLYVAANRPVAGLVLQNPPPLRRLILGYYGWWNLWVAAGPLASRVPPELDSIANGSRCSALAVFISAGADPIIPARYHRMVIDAYAGPKQVIEMPGADHDAPLTREAAADFARGLDWLWGVGLNGSGRSALRPVE